MAGSRPKVAEGPPGLAKEWARRADLSTLERVGDGYVTDDLRERESDVVWRLRLGAQSWVYVYLLLEFQSTVDPSMAMRVLSKVVELWEVKTMLAENTIDWTREWKDMGRQEGRQEGRQAILQTLRPAVLAQLEQRFGALSEETKRRVEAIDSGEEMASLLKRILSARSLAELGLAS